MEKNRTTRYILMIAVLAGLAAYTYPLRFRRTADSEPPALESLSLSAASFQGRDEFQEPESLKMLAADRTLFRSYRSDEGRVVWLFIGYFASQQENSQIHSPKHCYPGSGWNIIAEGSTPLDGGMTVRHLHITDGREERVVLYWFDTGSAVVTDEFALKWHQMRSALLGRPQSATFIRFSTRVEPGEEPDVTRSFLAAFARTMAPEIERVLGGAG